MENKNAIVLDLGCGPGTWIMVIKKNKKIKTEQLLILIIGCCN